MMTQVHGGTILERMGAKLMGIIFHRGWPRRILFLLGVVVILMAFMRLRQGTGYRGDPSSLVPREVSMYLETRELGPLMDTIGSLKLWSGDRQLAGGVMATPARELSVRVINRIDGLGTRPLRWLSSPVRAAFCTGNREISTEESWAWYLHMPEPSALISDIADEPKVVMETVSSTKAGSVHRMRDGNGRELYLGAIGEWFILSSDEWLPIHALETFGKPSVSLAGSGMLPEFERGWDLRGLFDPEKKSLRIDTGNFFQSTTWLAPESRVVVTARITGQGSVETAFNFVTYSENRVKDRWWPLVAIILVVVLLIAVAVCLAITLIVVGLSAWVKAAAIRAGISPAPRPIRVEPSRAFTEDTEGSGDPEGKIVAAATILPDDTKGIAARAEQEVDQLVQNEIIVDTVVPAVEEETPNNGSTSG